MNYSLQQLNKVEEFANLLTLPKVIAIIMEIDQKEFLLDVQDEGSDLYKAFYKGFLLREIEIKKSMKDGSIVDVFEKEFTVKQLAEFKAKLIIELDG